MLCGEPAFPVRDHDTESKFYGRIKAGQYDLHKPAFKTVSADAKDLLAGMLTVDPAKRLSASECLMHPWITGHAHKMEHTQHMPSVQQSMRIRLEKRNRK